MDLAMAVHVQLEAARAENTKLVAEVARLNANNEGLRSNINNLIQKLQQISQLAQP